ncbi:MAG: response regulator transcription factor [Gammaproteobacteria bacterium]|nr:response regulator transcription factor [Gammaproteobacteria bacterium]
MKILIIEDDQAVVKNLVNGLAENGISSDSTFDGETGLKMATNGRYEVLIIDRMLPKIDGLTIVSTLRQNHVTTPIIFLTALSEVDDKVKGLDAGADDYMAKPFAFVELLARIKALTKRSKSINENTTVTINELVIDKVNRTVIREGKKILLQPKEFDLLMYLANKQNETVTRKMLLEEVWGFDFNPQTNIVDVHISRLRNKVDKDFRDPLIQTVRGIGYTLTSD